MVKAKVLYGVLHYPYSISGNELAKFKSNVSVNAPFEVATTTIHYTFTAKHHQHPPSTPKIIRQITQFRQLFHLKHTHNILLPFPSKHSSSPIPPSKDSRQAA